jgi:glycosyltransferase involved in cell wall biosynthesis
MTNDRIRVLELRSVRGTGGGPEKTILMGAQQADRGRFDVTVCYIRDGRDRAFGIDARAASLGIDYVELLERRSFDPALWPALRRIVRERAIDIVHAHEYKTDLLALLLARSDGTIPLATAHGWTGHSRRERWVYYALDKQVLRAFPLTIAVSSQIREELVRHHVPPDRVRVVLNGIDPRAFRRDAARRSAVRHELGLADDDVVIGAIGRLEPQKRFDILLHACATIKERRPNLRLLIAGDGSLRADLEALAGRLFPRGGATLLGHQADVVRLHHAFDVFAQSSDYEGTPNSVLEAMALETPIVATAAGGTAEIAEDERHGLIVPCGDVSALAVAIERTIDEPVRAAARVVLARRRVETTLSFGARVACIERIYRELMATHPRRLNRRVAEQCA